ncbi:hypothetical protein [Neobacillus terrae]|uniref:hypothetical protein n=1 Tax=Neobacillus terrae TaxID=3034837 RepID=UPI00140D4B71|nr:hypothetical protein [Neobacillus terrae]NHM31286.1 hypothetical protein [Neobacillus terrae]
MVFNNGDDTKFPNEVWHLGDYYPYWNYGPEGKVKNDKFDDHCNHILNLKKLEKPAINHFFDLVNPILNNDISICVVPSSTAEKTDTGIKRLARMLASNNRIDGTNCLQRHTSIPKATNGGPRNKQNHLDTIQVVSTHLITGRKVLLLDDVATSESSISACEQLLLEYGAKKVVKLVLGYTKR